MAFGHGRMPLHTVDGKQYVSPTSITILPKDVPTITPLDPSWKVSVELASIEKLITADRSANGSLPPAFPGSAPSEDRSGLLAPH